MATHGHLQSMVGAQAYDSLGRGLESARGLPTENQRTYCVTRISARGRSSRVQRQAHRKRRPLSGSAVDGYGAAMGAHEGVDDAETKSSAAGGCAAPGRVAAPEALEDAGLVLGGDPGPIIGDGHLG